MSYSRFGDVNQALHAISNEIKTKYCIINYIVNYVSHETMERTVKRENWKISILFFHRFWK